MPMSPRLLRPIQSGFDPRRISGLNAWWDATDTATIDLDGNGGVSLWRDKSGNSRTAEQTVANNRPVLGTLAGRQAVLFDGTDDVMPFNAWLTASSETLFVVFNSVPDGSGQSALGNLVVYRSTPGTILYQACGFGGGFVVAFGVLPSSRILVVARLDSTGTVAGATVTNAPAVTSTGACVTRSNVIQGFSNASSLLTGAIGEFLHYSRRLPDAQFAAVERYLLNKWRV